MTARAFLLEAARYFENRPTAGEDRAHWANVMNAENCRKAVAEVDALVEALDNCVAILGALKVAEPRGPEFRAAWVRGAAVLAKHRPAKEPQS